VLKTYTFYLRHGEQADRPVHAPHDLDRDPFEPVLCQNDSGARERAEEMLSTLPDCVAIDVCFGRDLLFRISRDSS